MRSYTSLLRLHRLGAILVAAATWALVVQPVLAHEAEVIKYGSFLGGLTHPVLGPDHLLAMLSVGVISAQIGGRALWSVPATFVSVMAVGGLVGVAYGGLPMALIEFGIALSVVVLGSLIAVARRLPTAAAMVAVGAFGFLHGYAHGVETPGIADPAVYAAGFLIGTAGIHLMGVLLGEVARQYRAGGSVLRVAGAAIATLGATFVVGIL